MHVATRRAGICASALLGLAGALAGCGSSSSTQPGSSSPSSPSQPSSGNQATLKLTLVGLTGKETAMNVRYNIGASALTRASAASVLPQLHICQAETASLVCTATLSVGNVVSFFAVEAVDGSAVPLHGATSLPAEPTSMTEFAQFTGDCAQTTAAFGDCTLTAASAREYDVRAQFSLMNTIVFNALGAGTFTVSVVARSQLAIPTLPNGIQAAGPGTYSFIVGGQAAPTQVDWVPLGSTVTVAAAGSNQAKFLKWTGSCQSGGGANSCTLFAPGGAAAPSPATATAFFQYWDCGNGAYADGPANGCTLVNPSSISSPRAIPAPGR
jgi:hypothetical protein